MRANNVYLNYIKRKYERQKLIVEKLESELASDLVISQAKKEKLSLRDHLEHLEKNYPE